MKTRSSNESGRLTCRHVPHLWLAGCLMLAICLMFALAAAVSAVGVFPDVDPLHPYHGAVRELAMLNVIKGYSNGNFGPEDPVTRQQFAKMIVKTAGYEVPADIVCPFGDVAAQQGNDPLYPSKYVAVCAAHGITVGKTPTKFDPYGQITRYQAISMVVTAADDLQPQLLPAPPPEWESESGWTTDPTHGANVARAEYGELLAGLDFASDPYGPITRGEVAQILHKLIARLTYASNPLRSILFLGFNTQQPPLDNAKVRLALSLALDRQAISTASGIPGASPATGWLAAGIPGFADINQGFLQPTAQLAQAAAALASAGYPNGAGLPEIKIQVMQAHQALANLVKSQWGAIGVSATVVVVPWNEYWPLLGSGTDLYVFRLGWIADFNDPYEYYGLLRTGSTWNFTRWSNETFDQLLDQALAASSEADALAVYQQLEKMITEEEVPVAPLYWF
ncbi:MAG: ABC transporter substrate-binding protein [Thermoleophilia bacterium]|nr:ABC transporter substrate-binding protein [Thermoleophilia bacterium]